MLRRPLYVTYFVKRLNNPMETLKSLCSLADDLINGTLISLISSSMLIHHALLLIKPTVLKIIIGNKTTRQQVVRSY